MPFNQAIQRPSERALKSYTPENRGPILGSFKFKENSNLFFFFFPASVLEMLYHSSCLRRYAFSSIANSF